MVIYIDTEIPGYAGLKRHELLGIFHKGDLLAIHDRRLGVAVIGGFELLLGEIDCFIKMA